MPFRSWRWQGATSSSSLGAAPIVGASDLDGRGDGLRLFDRDARKVELTAEGRMFEAGAARVLEDLRMAMENLREHAARRCGGWRPRCPYAGKAIGHTQDAVLYASAADALTKGALHCGPMFGRGLRFPFEALKLWGQQLEK